MRNKYPGNGVAHHFLHVDGQKWVSPLNRAEALCLAILDMERLSDRKGMEDDSGQDQL